MNYLIPANTKRGKLIFGLFRTVDLIIFLCGLVVTFVLLAIFPMDNTVMAVLALAPALSCTLLVAPVPHYHNIMCLIADMYSFFSERRRFIWRGWCFVYESTKSKK